MQRGNEVAPARPAFHRHLPGREGLHQLAGCGLFKSTGVDSENISMTLDLSLVQSLTEFALRALKLLPFSPKGAVIAPRDGKSLRAFSFPLSGREVAKLMACMG